jgi:hypothetical protein
VIVIGKCVQHCPNHDVTPAQAGAHPEIVPHTARSCDYRRDLAAGEIYLEMGPGLRRGDTEFLAASAIALTMRMFNKRQQLVAISLLLLPTPVTYILGNDAKRQFRRPT